MWTEERIAQLKELHKMGLSSGQIAGRMQGFSRNAIIGKTHRLGLCGPRSGLRTGGRPVFPKGSQAGNSMRVVDKMVAARSKAKGPYHRTPEQMDDLKERRRARDLEILARAITPTDGDVARIQLVDLEPHHCRWPVGEPTQGFCGCTKQPGSSYCKAHFERSTSNNIKPHTWAHTIGVTAHKNAEEFLTPEAVA